MKIIQAKIRRPSTLTWVQTLILFLGLSSTCKAQTAPTAIDLIVTDALISQPSGTPTPMQVTLYWSNSAGAAYFQVCRSTTSGTGYVAVGSPIPVTNTTPSFADTPSVGTYYYVVTASNSSSTTCSSGFSPEAKAAITPAPSSVTVTPGSQMTTIVWTPQASTYAYNVYAYSTASTPNAYKVVCANLTLQTGHTTITCIDTGGPDKLGLQNGVTYNYKIAAFTGPNDINETDSANYTAAVSGYPSSPLPTVTSVIPNISSTSVALTWNATPNAVSYQVQSSTSSSGPWNTLSTQSATTYTDTNATSGTIVYYQIVASNGSNYGAPTKYNIVGVSTNITNVSFSTTATGTSGKTPSSWTYDVKQGLSQSAITTDLYNAGGSSTSTQPGANLFSAIRVAWYPEYPLYPSNVAPSSAVLDPIAQFQLDTEVADAGLVEHTAGTLYPFFLSPKTGSLDKTYYDNGSEIDPAKWMGAMQYSRDYYKNTYASQHATITYNGMENEDDNTGCQFLSSTWNTIYSARDANWGSTIWVGPDSYTSGDAALWLGYTGTGPYGPLSTCENPPNTSSPNNIVPMNSYVTKASSHAIGGTLLSDFVDFIETARDTDNLALWLTEIHSIVEPLVALNTGVKQGIARALWWSPITSQRGDYMRYSKNNQIFYQGAADNLFAATAAYFQGNPATKPLSIFIANNSQDSSQIGIYETFTFTCTNQTVHFGSGPLATSYTTTLQSLDNQNAETEITVTW